MYDDWINAMMKDLGIEEKKEGEKKNEVALSDADIKKVADSVIERLSSEDDISTSKPDKKEKKQEQEQEQNEDLDEGETPIE